MLAYIQWQVFWMRGKFGKTENIGTVRPQGQRARIRSPSEPQRHIS